MSHKLSHHTDNAAIRWFVIHTQPHQEAKVCTMLRQAAEDGNDGHGNILGAWMPTRSVAVVGRDKDVVQALLNGLVFVRATERAAAMFLANRYSEGFLLRDRTGQGLMVIPDAEMQRFIDFNARLMADMLVLERPYYNYDTNPQLVRARVNDGPFAGLEGVLIHLRNERRLVFRLGELAIAISQIWRYRLTRINTINATPSPEEQAMRPHLVADRFIGRLQATGCTDNAPHRLRFLLHRLKHCGSMARLRTELNLSAITHPDEVPDHATLQDFLKNLTGEDAADLLSLAHLVAATAEAADTFIPLRPLRPFLTPTAGILIPDETAAHIGTPDTAKPCVHLPRRDFTELVCPVTVEELFHDRDTGTTMPQSRTYYAHVALVPTAAPGTPSLLITDWSALITPYNRLEGAAKIRQDNTFATYCPDLLALFRGTHPSGITIQTVTLPDGTTITGPAHACPADSSIPLSEYLDPLVAICKTIAASTHLAAWRGYLRGVWIA